MMRDDLRSKYLSDEEIRWLSEYEPIQDDDPEWIVNNDVLITPPDWMEGVMLDEPKMILDGWTREDIDNVYLAIKRRRKFVETPGWTMATRRAFTKTIEFLSAYGKCIHGYPLAFRLDP
jgi:hypothetical protein